MNDDTANQSEGAIFDTRKDAGEGGAGEVKLWMTAIDLASKDEEKWRTKQARGVVDKFKAAGGGTAMPSFNILFSNTETIIPAIFNSDPIPDIRRRFGDEDPAGKVAGQVAERAVAYQIDAYDLNNAMQLAVMDMVLPGRGVTRIRYKPVTDADTGQAYEAVCAEHVQWDDFRRGPGRAWDEVPWVGFKHLLTREQVVQLNSRVGASIPLDQTIDGVDKDRKDENESHDVFKRLLVWEVWDKETRRVLFIAPAYKVAPLLIEDDPMKLEGFFPIPRPLYAIRTTDSLIPIEPYRLYEKQAEELDIITKRIKAIVQVLKWRGIRAVTEDDGAFDQLSEADDGELVPATSVMSLLSAGGGLDKAIWLMPIEQAVQVVRELYAAREQVKQTIYEITGIADILRGSTEASETATAQQIKAQWGSLRIQRMQTEVARYARDLIRLMVEVICTRFDWPTLSAMTQTELPTNAQMQQAQAMMQQAQQEPPPPEIMASLQAVLDADATVEQVEEILRSDMLRCYRIDVETDSTVRGDVQGQQENLSNFVQGFGQFIQAVGPAVEAGVMQVDEATDLLTGFARVFKLGRQAEDALDRLGKRAQEQARNPQPPQEDPQIAMEREKLAADKEERAARLQMEQEAKAAEMGMKQAEQQQSMSIAQRKADFEERQAERQAAMEQRKLEQEHQFREREFAMKEEEAVARVGLDMAKLREGQSARKEGYEREDSLRKADGLAPGTYEEDVKEVTEGLKALAEVLMENTKAQQEQTKALIAAMTAPKRVVRGANGRAEGVETVLN